MIFRWLDACVDVVGSLWVLATMAIASGFRLRSPYWKWRMATAFPVGSVPASKLKLALSGLEYARWAWRIRRLR